MELRQLRYFVTLAEELHFARAAARLHIAGPSLSQQIAALERAIGSRLFERDPRHVELTPAGEVLLPHAQRALSVETELMEAMRDLSSALTGPATIGALMGGAGTITTQVVRAFKDAHPDVEVRVRDLETTHIIDPLLTGDIDAALIWGPVGDPRIALTPLFHQPRVLVVSETNPLADAAALSVDDVLAQRHGEQVPGEPDDWEGFWNLVPERNGEQPHRVDINMTGQVSEQLYSLSYNDATLSVPASFAQAYPAAQFGLTYIPLTGVAPATCSVAVRRHRPGPIATTLRRIAVDIAHASYLAEQIPGNRSSARSR
ncbi:MAG: LysR family transcriptional regulator [Ornithinimicrobium sp.]